MHHHILPYCSTYAQGKGETKIDVYGASCKFLASFRSVIIKGKKTSNQAYEQLSIVFKCFVLQPLKEPSSDQPCASVLQIYNVQAADKMVSEG